MRGQDHVGAALQDLNLSGQGAGGPAEIRLGEHRVDGVPPAGELVCGLWFTVRPRSPAMVPVWVYTGVSLVWAGLGVQAMARGLEVANCGCFGVYLSQRLSWFVLAQDALLLVYVALLIRGGMRARHRQPADAQSVQEFAA